MPRTARIRRLTAVAVKAYAERAGSAPPLHDGGGLYLRRRGTTARWYLRTTDPLTGAQQWHLMFPDDPAGGYPYKSLAQAREEAERMREVRSRGLDPRAERKRAIEAQRVESARRITVRKLFGDWKAIELQSRKGSDGKRRGRKDDGAEVERLFELRVLPRIGDILVPDLRKSDLMAIIDRARAAGRLRTANILLATLKQMLRFALVREIIDRNPLDTVTRRDAGGAETPRERVLSESEIRALALALPAANLEGRSSCAIWLILATAARVGELMSARWEHVDLRQRTWYLPQTKNQRDHLIHLSDFAIRQFEEIARLQRVRDARRRARATGRRASQQPAHVVSSSPWVFSNAKGTEHIDITTFGKQLADRQRTSEGGHPGRTTATGAMRLAGGRWTAHDLRRTAATMMAELGVSGDVIDECLNHMSERSVRRTYIRDRRLAEQARALDALGQRLHQLTGVGDHQTVAHGNEAAHAPEPGRPGRAAADVLATASASP